ncbi:MAG: hypothetical protein JW794_05560 [Candidatus Cloacimonetes bacterium]|nr:hypothetical protein [Candidatus Cloacimonadota bacterium]
MNKKLVLIVISILLISGIAYSQPGHFHPMGDQKKVILQLRNLELLKALDLSDEESEKVLPVIKDIDLLMESSYDTHKMVVKNLKDGLKAENKKEITKNIDLLITHEHETNTKRVELYKKLRKTLGEEKFAEYLIFMESFGRDLQDKVRMLRDGDKYPDKPKEGRNK